MVLVPISLVGFEHLLLNALSLQMTLPSITHLLPLLISQHLFCRHGHQSLARLFSKQDIAEQTAVLFKIEADITEVTAVILGDRASFVVLGVESVFKLADATSNETILRVTLILKGYGNRHFRSLLLEVFEEEVAEFATN